MCHGTGSTTIEYVLSNTSINTIQLHGTESIDFIQEIKKKYSSIKITKALAADENIIQNINKYKGFVDLLLSTHPQCRMVVPVKHMTGLF